MKKLLFPVSERDYFATSGRICHLLNGLSKHFIVEVLTISNEVYDDINKKLGSPSSNILTRIIEAESLPVTDAFRDDLAKGFVQYTYDMVVPGTDLKLWKPTAFDDFWGHLSGSSFPEIGGIDADMVLFPLMNYDEAISDVVDVFYTTLLFDAKEAGIKVAGYQVYPAVESGLLMAGLMDAIIVRKEYEKQFYVKKGIAPEKISVLTDIKDIYSLSTIEDVYKNHLYNSQITVSRSELGVVVFNHSRFRPQLTEIFRVITETRIPVVLFLVKRNFVIREFTEDKIIEGVFLKYLQKIKGRFYVVGPDSIVPVVMISDVAISPSYISPVEFSALNGKGAWIYNPMNDPMPDNDGVMFIKSPVTLARSLKRAYKTKNDTVGMIDIINELTAGKR
ncbi:MAG: hypothetical protein ACLQF0_08295 [Dissulfurispiraceae bacterium]